MSSTQVAATMDKLKLEDLRHGISMPEWKKVAAIIRELETDLSVAQGQTDAAIDDYNKAKKVVDAARELFKLAVKGEKCSVVIGGILDKSPEAILKALKELDDGH